MEYILKEIVRSPKCKKKKLQNFLSLNPYVNQQVFLSGISISIFL